jgi:hypothetical protein
MAPLKARYEALMDLLYAGFSAGGYRDKTMWRIQRAVNRGRAVAARIPQKEVEGAVGHPFRKGEGVFVVRDGDVCTTVGKQAVSCVPDGRRVTWTPRGWAYTSCRCGGEDRFAPCTCSPRVGKLVAEEADCPCGPDEACSFCMAVCVSSAESRASSVSLKPVSS